MLNFGLLKGVPSGTSNKFLTILSVDVGTGGVTNTFINDGSNNIGTTLVGNGVGGDSTFKPLLDISLDGAYTGIATLTFKLTVRSGIARMNGGEWRSSTAWLGAMGISSASYGVGIHEITSTPFDGIDIEKIKLYFDGQNYPTFDFDIELISVEVI